jgi:hypothetical protein
MAETLAEKLKRLAREKAAAKAAAESPTVAEVTEVANVQPVEESKAEEVSDDAVPGLSSSGELQGQIAQAAGSEPRLDEDKHSTAVGDREVTEGRVPVENSNNDSSGNSAGTDNLNLPVPETSSHPLSMQFLELEQALDSTDPSFKTKLRDIHRHLGTDPDLVTQMTEAEIALVVKGLVVFANAEIVEPAKAKSVKAATAAAKKKVISADDL